jgi:hypothetical protein
VEVLPVTDPVQQAILDAASYLARNQVGGGTAPGRPGASSADVVDTALESLLGAVPNNPRDFRTLLGRAFTTVDVDGHTETRYRRPSTGGRMMLNGGGVLTGAQASMVSRANRARDEIYDNLDPLKPLALTPDPDAVRDVRSLIHTVVDSIVEELRRPGGPTVIRVDRLLAELAGEDAVASPPVVNAERFGGLLARLADVFGMDREEISSLDDEQTFTSFVCIVGAAGSLATSWATDRTFLDPLSGEPYLGTQLVQIERALAVVGQAVEEARQALDRADVEPTERELPRRVDIDGDTVTTSIGAVLAWAEEYARRGHDRLRYGGQDGIDSFVTEATELARLLKALGSGIEPQDGLSGVGSQPVLDSLEALHDCIRQSRRLAARLLRGDPVVLADAAIYPVALTGRRSRVRPGLILSLYGAGFREGTAVRLFSSADTEVPVLWRHVVSDSRIDLALAVDRDAQIVRVTAENVGAEPAGLDLTTLRPMTTADHTPAGSAAGDPSATNGTMPLSLRLARMVPTEVAAADPADRTNRSTVRPGLTITLFGSGFDDKTDVQLWSGDVQQHPDDRVVLTDSVLEVVVARPAGRRIDRIVVAQPDGRNDELIIDWPAADEPDPAAPTDADPALTAKTRPGVRVPRVPRVRAQRPPAPTSTDKKGK